MAKKVYDAVATVGEYQKGGETKKRYLTVGAVFENDKGQMSLKLDALPTVKEWSGWISFYEPKQYDGGQRQAAPTQHERAKADGYAPKPQEQEDDDIPF